MMIATRDPPRIRSLAWESMCSRNRSWPSLMRGSPGAKRPAAPRSCSARTVSHVQPPVLSVGRIGDHVVEGGAGVPVIR